MQFMYHQMLFKWLNLTGNEKNAVIRVLWIFYRPVPRLCTDVRKCWWVGWPLPCILILAKAAIKCRLVYSSKQVAQGQSQAVPDTDLPQSPSQEAPEQHTWWQTSDHIRSYSISSTSSIPKDFSSYQALLGTNLLRGVSPCSEAGEDQSSASQPEGPLYWQMDQ